jgi:hypothetical protein
VWAIEGTASGQWKSIDGVDDLEEEDVMRNARGDVVVLDGLAGGG